MQMESSDEGAPLPAYTFVPGGPWPHPHRTSGARGNAAGARGKLPEAGKSGWSAWFLRGVELFNAGYYWEAHEYWEDLWHVEGRRGPTADVLRALIKLAAAGVKVRESRPGGVSTHCRRAGELFASVAAQAGARHLGLDLELLAERSRELAENPPRDPGPSEAAVTRVFAFGIEPASREPLCDAAPGPDPQTTC
jgi:uncharacterized protein